VRWFRGYRFEDDELVERWLDRVFDGVSYALPACFQALGHMEVYLAALAFRDRCQAEGLAVCFPELTEEAGPCIRGLFNPLLLAQDVVPVVCDLEQGSFETTTIVTGPNSGGKTRLLQAVGLLQLLGQVGLYAPAAEARIRPVPNLFASVHEQLLADQPEGHLGTELLRIRRLFETSRHGTLVLLDELCSGTNPSEAAELFTMVLDLLGELGSEVYVTTHFLELAQRLAANEPSASMAFLQAELDAARQPTFRFVAGVAETSLAAETAVRLGVTRERLAALARRRAAP
jgi:DNA mismatch repair protein MutS2